MELFEIEPWISQLAEDSYLDAATADVHFIFKSSNNEHEERIPAHKILLKFRSDVFGAMFYGELKEDGDVRIVDATIDAFKEFLKTFYFDEPNIEMGHISEVLNLIRKYNVKNCMTACDRFLRSSVTVDNVCWIYDLAMEFELSITKHCCERVISLKAEEIFKSNDFLERSYETVLQIINLNYFVCDEYTIFTQCIAWAKEACDRDGLDNTEPVNLRNQLRDILYRIRFRSMNSTHVGDIIQEYYNLFTHDELADVALLALSHSEPKTSISKEHRICAWDLNALQECFFSSRKTGPTKKLEPNESVTFSSNIDIILRQVRLWSLYSIQGIKIEKHDNVNVKLQIVEKFQNNEDYHEKNLYTTALNAVEFGSWFEFPIMIFIKPKAKYEIRLEYLDTSDNKYQSFTRENDETVICGITISGRGTSIAGMKFCCSKC